MRRKLHFLTRHRGVIAILGFSLVLYSLPSRFAYPVTGRIASATANIAAFFQVKQDKPAPSVEQLRHDLIQARQKLTQARNEIHLLRRELESITHIKGSAASQFARIIPARIILRRDASNFRRTVLVNRGSRHGVSPGLPVLWGGDFSAEDGIGGCVIGIVDTVGPNACRILLASDPGFRVPARMLESRDRFIAEGKSAGPSEMRLKHVGMDAVIEVGDAVVTSSSLGIFPPGLLVGIVTETEGHGYAGELEISVASPIDLDELESVVIVQLALPDVPGDAENSGTQDNFPEKKE